MYPSAFDDRQSYSEVNSNRTFIGDMLKIVSDMSLVMLVLGAIAGLAYLLSKRKAIRDYMPVSLHEHEEDDNNDGSPKHVMELTEFTGSDSGTTNVRSRGGNNRRSGQQMMSGEV